MKRRLLLVFMLALIAFGAVAAAPSVLSAPLGLVTAAQAYPGGGNNPSATIGRCQWWNAGQLVEQGSDGSQLWCNSYSYQLDIVFKGSLWHTNWE